MSDHLALELTVVGANLKRVFPLRFVALSARMSVRFFVCLLLHFVGWRASHAGFLVYSAHRRLLSERMDERKANSLGQRCQSIPTPGKGAAPDSWWSCGSQFLSRAPFASACCSCFVIIVSFCFYGL